tara:strand:- start:416 stop:526 length:111 start_codon:yes stop_codon:yes gene_type:complete
VSFVTSNVQAVVEAMAPAVPVPLSKETDPLHHEKMP